MPCHAMPCHAMPCNATPRHATIRYATIRYAALCCTMLCCAALCCATLFHVPVLLIIVRFPSPSICLSGCRLLGLSISQAVMSVSQAAMTQNMSMSLFPQQGASSLISPRTPSPRTPDHLKVRPLLASLVGLAGLVDLPIL